VVATLLNRRVFEGVFDDREATFDGRTMIFKKRWFLEDFHLPADDAGEGRQPGNPPVRA
jgi:hypothetical protein